MLLRMAITLWITVMAGGKRGSNWLTGTIKTLKISRLVWFCINPASTFGSEPAQPGRLVGLTQTEFSLHYYGITAGGLLNVSSTLQQRRHTHHTYITHIPVLAHSLTSLLSHLFLHLDSRGHQRAIKRSRSWSELGLKLKLPEVASLVGGSIK